MSMFDVYVNLRTPPIPPYDELPKTYGDLCKFMTKLYLSEDSIRNVAYDIWEEDGRPNGDDWASDHGYYVGGIRLCDMHWILAKWRLEIVLDTDVSTVWALLPGKIYD